MSEKASRKILSLPKKTRSSETEEREFELDLFDVLLPCRNFHLAYRFAEVGAVSLVTEFLLRIIHATEQILEQDVAAFFGFDDREMRFALEEVSAKGYVSRSDGALTLTSAGRSLFQYDQAVPQIYSVQARQSTYGFDLIALAPQEQVALSEFERAFRELPISNVERVSRASTEIRTSFRRWFFELLNRNDRDSLKSASLYSIDDVSAGRRYSGVIPVLLRSATSRPSSPEPDLSLWRTPPEIDDRGDIVQAIAAYVENLKIAVRDDDSVAYSILKDVAPDFLSEYTRKDGSLSVERYFGEATKRAGELRIDRPTIPIVGTLFTPNNRRRLTDALGYASKKQEASTPPERIHWLIPARHWGQSRALAAILGDLTTICASGNTEEQSDPPNKIALCCDRTPDHISTVFDGSIRPREASTVPPSLEILFVPRMVTAVLVHCPVLTTRGIPVPLGILSFDVATIERVQTFLADNFELDQRAAKG